MKCKDCLHYEACRDVYNDLADKNYSHEFDEEDYARISCVNFTDRSEWVHLPDEEYTFTVRGDIALGIIIANCRAAEAEKALEEKK